MDSSATFSGSFTYNQRDVLVENISRFTTADTVGSLLDIGAGFGGTAVPLAATVRRYVAVEEVPARVQALRGAGLEVVEGRFPCPISGSFDFVLSSHSVPEGDLDLYPPFLEAGWKLLNAGGTFLVVTFKGNRGAAVRCREEMTGHVVPEDPQYTTLLCILRTFGSVNIEKVNSYLESNDADDIVAWIEDSVLRAGESRDRDIPQLKALLAERFRRGDRYRFPTEHLFISVRKQRAE
jgi:SAM-dependent methyltransferase